MKQFISFADGQVLDVTEQVKDLCGENAGENETDMALENIADNEGAIDFYME